MSAPLLATSLVTMVILVLSALPVGRGHVFAGDVRDGARAAIAHYQLQFALHNFEHAIDAGLAECAESPKERTPNAHGFGTERQSLEHVRTPANAPVDEYGQAAAHFGDDFGQGLNGGAARFGGTSTVIRNEDAVDAVLDAEAR